MPRIPSRKLPSCSVFATNVSSDAITASQGGGPGNGHRGQMSSLSRKEAIARSAPAITLSAAALLVMFAAAAFELAAETRNDTAHGTGSGLNWGNTSLPGPCGFPICPEGRLAANV